MVRMAIPSMCPECGALLKHTKRLPAGAETPLEINCLNCGFEDVLIPE